ALLDSGAEGIIMHSHFAKAHHFTLRPLQQLFPICNVDGTKNIMGWVYHDLILGTNWVDEHNPKIDWTTTRVDLTRCPDSC
ncbi:hypothetical protein C8T65DRAFT_516237, partial [Cerioporus squamosus]